MPQGDKSSYTAKQRRQAEHIEKGYEHKGISKKTAQKRAWATVNKQDGGAKGVKKKATPKKKGATTKTTRKTAAKQPSRSRSAAARKAARTRKRKSS